MQIFQFKAHQSNLYTFDLVNRIFFLSRSINIYCFHIFLIVVYWNLLVDVFILSITFLFIRSIHPTSRCILYVTLLGFAVSLITIVYFLLIFFRSPFGPWLFTLAFEFLCICRDEWFTQEPLSWRDFLRHYHPLISFWTSLPNN